MRCCVRGLVRPWAAASVSGAWFHALIERERIPPGHPAHGLLPAPNAAPRFLLRPSPCTCAQRCLARTSIRLARPRTRPCAMLGSHQRATLGTHQRAQPRRLGRGPTSPSTSASRPARAAPTHQRAHPMVCPTPPHTLSCAPGAPRTSAPSCAAYAAASRPARPAPSSASPPPRPASPPRARSPSMRARSRSASRPRSSAAASRPTNTASASATSPTLPAPTASHPSSHARPRPHVTSPVTRARPPTAAVGDREELRFQRKRPGVVLGDVLGTCWGRAPLGGTCTGGLVRFRLGVGGRASWRAVALRGRCPRSLSAVRARARACGCGV
jgi:hypothetical protein